MIGALSLVNKDVPEGAVVAGIPARIIRFRNKEEIDDFHEWIMQQGGINITD